MEQYIHDGTLPDNEKTINLLVMRISLFVIYLQLHDLSKIVDVIRHFESEEMCEMLLCTWDIVEEIVQVLSVPYQATVVMQKENYTLSDFYACWLLMLRKLNKISTTQSKTNLAQNLLKKMIEREHQFFGNAAISCALALDPRFCGAINKEQKNIARDTLTKLWEHIKSEETCSSTNLDSSDIDITVENTTIL